MWRYVKAHVYTDKPASIDALADNMEAFISEIPDEMLERVCQNWTKRMDHMKRSRSHHLHEIIFKQHLKNHPLLYYYQEIEKYAGVIFLAEEM